MGGKEKAPHCRLLFRKPRLLKQNKFTNLLLLISEREKIQYVKLRIAEYFYGFEWQDKFLKKLDILKKRNGPGS